MSEGFLKSVWLLSIHFVSAYAIPLNPSMLFIFSLAFERLRFLYQWPDVFGYKEAVSPHFGTVRVSFPIPS